MNVKRRATAGAVAWRFRVAESRVEARPKLSVPIKECERPKSSEDEIKNLGDERIKCMLRGHFLTCICTFLVLEFSSVIWYTSKIIRCSPELFVQFSIICNLPVDDFLDKVR